MQTDKHTVLYAQQDAQKKKLKVYDMADVCELAHKRTIRDIRLINKTYGFSYKVNCRSLDDCGDTAQAHKRDEEYDELGTHYGRKAQEVFDDHYDEITDLTGL